MSENDPTPLETPEIPAELPGLALRSTVVFPFDVVSVQLDRPRSMRMVEANPGDATLVAAFFPKDREAERLTEVDDFEPVGVVCRVIHRMRMPNETVQVVLQGLQRVRLTEVSGVQPHYRFGIEPISEREPRGADIDGLIYRCMELVDELVKADPENIAFQRKQAELRGSIGFANELAGNKEKAKEVYTAAVHQWEHLASLLPEDDIVERGLTWSRRQLAGLGR